MPTQPKAKIPKALREQVWRNYSGATFERKCFVTWCTNRINTFDFAVGHNIPESHGGALNLQNLRPICSRCNASMGNHYTIDEWSRMSPIHFGSPSRTPTPTPTPTPGRATRSTMQISPDSTVRLTPARPEPPRATNPLCRCLRWVGWYR